MRCNCGIMHRVGACSSRESFIAFECGVGSADFGLAQLAQSGSRLKSVLLYHMMPGGAFTLDQLASAGNVTTLLGQDLNASYPLQWGKNSTGDVSSLTGHIHSKLPCFQLSQTWNFSLLP